MPDRPAISVIIPAWNEEAYIGRTLEAVFEAVSRLETSGVNAEVIVVDNCSSDRTAELAANSGARVIVERRRQISAVRNAGARAARGEGLAFVDADSRPSPNALLKIHRALSSGAYAGGGVRIIPERWTLKVLPLFMIAPAMRVVLGVSAGMIFATREAFRAVGGFDERLYAAEDLELVRALKAYADKNGKYFANLSDVNITTSVRKLDKARWRDWLIFPKYLLDPESARRRENCNLWYAEGHR